MFYKVKWCNTNFQEAVDVLHFMTFWLTKCFIGMLSPSIARESCIPSLLAIKLPLWINWRFFLNPSHLFILNELAYPIFISLFIYLSIFREKDEGRERETSICFFTYLCNHWLLLVCALIEGQSYDLGMAIDALTNLATWPIPFHLSMSFILL